MTAPKRPRRRPLNVPRKPSSLKGSVSVAFRMSQAQLDTLEVVRVANSLPTISAANRFLIDKAQEILDAGNS